MGAQALIDRFGLIPHPEGGWYTETWRPDTNGRPSGTAILFLLADGQASHWHRVDAVEIWHYYAGAPLVLSLSATDQGPAQDHVLGIDFETGASPQLIVPENHWQAARTTGDFTLVGCTVSPGFEFSGFHLAKPDFDIPRG